MSTDVLPRRSLCVSLCLSVSLCGLSTEEVSVSPHSPDRLSGTRTRTTRCLSCTSQGRRSRRCARCSQSSVPGSSHCKQLLRPAWHTHVTTSCGVRAPFPPVPRKHLCVLVLAFILLLGWKLLDTTNNNKRVCTDGTAVAVLSVSLNVSLPAVAQRRSRPLPKRSLLPSGTTSLAVASTRLCTRLRYLRPSSQYASLSCQSDL